MRLVVDLIRGENVEKALYILKYTNKEAAIRVEKFCYQPLKTGKQKMKTNVLKTATYM